MGSSGCSSTAQKSGSAPVLGVLSPGWFAMLVQDTLLRLRGIKCIQLYPETWLGVQPRASAAATGRMVAVP